MASDGASKIYTKGGDKGQTSLIGGTRVSKSGLRLDCYGTLDELNSVIGLLVCEVRADFPDTPEFARSVLATLEEIQNDLFNAGSQLACEDPKLRVSLPSVDDAAITALEKAMDSYSTVLKPLKNFIIPGGARSASIAHLARTTCRRAERHCVLLLEEHPDDVDLVAIRFVNRLSDYFFVLARLLNHFSKIDEPIWKSRETKQK